MEEQKVCPVAKKCGGCSWQGISYEEQLKKKQKQIRKLLKNICPVEPIIGMKNPYHYRNKVNAAFAHRRDGSIVSGVYEEGTQDRKSTRLNSSHIEESRMPSSA